MNFNSVFPCFSIISKISPQLTTYLRNLHLFITPGQVPQVLPDPRWEKIGEHGDWKWSSVGVDGWFWYIYIYNMHMKITNAWNTFLKPLFLKQTKFFWAWTLFWDHLLRVLKVFRRSPLPPVKNVSLFWWPLKIISRGGAPIKTILAPA